MEIYRKKWYNNRMKKKNTNPIAKFAHLSNKSVVFIDRKKEFKKGKRLKYKGKNEE